MKQSQESLRALLKTENSREESSPLLRKLHETPSEENHSGILSTSGGALCPGVPRRGPKTVRPRVPYPKSPNQAKGGLCK